MANIPIDEEFKEKLRNVLNKFQINESKPLNIIKKSLDLVLEMNADIERLLEMLSKYLKELNTISPELNTLISRYLLKYFDLN